MKPSGYAPKWHVGDWWVVKTWQRYSPDWGSQCTRYDVTGVEKVGQQYCYVLEARFQEANGWLASTKNVLYVGTDDWLVVRRAWVRMYNDTLRTPDTLESPIRRFGPSGGGEPRLPRFPLVPGSADSTSRIQRRAGYAAELREVPRIAGSASVERLLHQGDSACGRVVRPTGVVHQVRDEVYGDVEPGPEADEVPLAQSVQYWSSDLPWRMYKELVLYYDPVFPEYRQQVVERSWLIAVGHKGK